jgi:hypothetical protein
VKARLSARAGRAACGHLVTAGQVTVRVGRRWVCGPCSLPGGTTTGPPRCPACTRPIVAAQLALSPVRGWVHLLCITDADRDAWNRAAAAVSA